jgi:hypothetical protein
MSSSFRTLVESSLLPLLLCAAPLACADASEAVDSSASEVVGHLGSGPIDHARETHLLVVGYSHGMGDQFIRAALSRAYRYKEAFPDRQIVLLGSPELGSQSDVEAFRGFGLEQVVDEGDLSDRKLLERMNRFRSIASFDYFGHSSPWAIGVESEGGRLGTTTKQSLLESVRGRFTQDAFVTLNGCNAGFWLGPYLSKAWQVPVSAALSASNFQQLHDNGRWYFNDAGLHPEGPWRRENAISFRSALSCRKGACYRLKPENSPYHGYWGDLSAGLGFYKSFCNYAGAEASCSRRVALGLYGFPSLEPADASSSRESFERVVFDYLCPNDSTGSRTQSCIRGIQDAVSRGVVVFSSFRGNPLECSDAGCTFDMDCTEDAGGNPVPGTCSMEAHENTRPTALVTEYLRLMEGYDQLHGGSGGSLTAIPEETLDTVNGYTVLAPSLNCRTGAGTHQAVASVLSAGDRVVATSTPERPRVVVAGNKPWLLVRRGEEAPCYVSAQRALLSADVQ